MTSPSVPDPAFYQTYRVGHFDYSTPVFGGSRYTVRLHFVEPWFTQADYCEGSTQY
jgi:hypothetical protein